MAVDDAQLRGNRLLRTLPASERTDLADRLQLRGFRLKELVYEQGDPIHAVAFPLHGVFSLLSFMRDGRGAEVATVGNEGIVGLPAFLQPALPQTHRAICQVAGDALVLRADELRALAASSDAVHTALHGYAQALIVQIAQGSVCNRLHTVEQRCVRWLLQSHDRARSDRFPLTQEFLGQMLGVGRQTVNQTARGLQDAGLIRYVRGTITIVDRRGLEQAGCECYAVVRSEFDRLLDPA